MTETLFIEPHDVLFLRGNKLFGDPGSYGESQVLPSPSVIAGAIRSALMVRKQVDFRAFATNELTDGEFGNAEQPGSFRVTAVHLARRDENDNVKAIYPLPADLSVGKSDEGEKIMRRLTPCPPTSLMTSSVTENLAIFPQTQRGKPETGLWLNEEGWRAHLAGHDVDPKHLLTTEDLWEMELRTGIGLDAAKRSAATGSLFTAQALSLSKREHKIEQEKAYDTGFLAKVEGVSLPHTLTLRLGGDGRAAQAERLLQDAGEYKPDWNKLCEDQRCRIILTSPGIFEGGWRPTGVTGNGRELRLDLGDIRARLTCAAVPRAEVISGWDLAKGRPKSAQRVAPTGSVYWLEDMEATPEKLRNLVGQGLWHSPGDNSARRTEGYNRFTFAAY